MLFLLVGAVILLTVFTEFLAKRKIIHAEISRKILHLSTTFLAGISVFIINFSTLLVVAFASLILTFLLVKYDILKSIRQNRGKSWGIFYFPLAYFFILYFWGQTEKWIVFESMLILGIADSSAALFGTFLSKKYFTLTGDKKSLIGSFAFFISSVILIYFYSSGSLQIITSDTSFLYVVLAAVGISIILTLFEAISSNGFDNFTVPILGSILLYIFFKNPDTLLLQNFLIGIVISALVALLSYRVKFLTLDGAVATFLLAGFIFGFGGLKWSVPIMSFFVLSSLLSKVRKKVNESVETYFEKTGVRDSLQVLANGGIGGILVIVNQLYSNEIFYLIYIASLAAVCADTWATEIGTLKKTKTYNVLNLKPIEQGTSGGISIIGTLGAITGSFIISISAFAWFGYHFFYYSSLIILAGVLGSFFDSILGATLQAQNKCDVCNKITEKSLHCGEEASHFKGIEWLNNDIVNLLSGITGGLIIILINGI